MMDDRPEVEADLFSYRPLPDPLDQDAINEVLRDLGEAMREAGADEVRWTIVSPDYPNPPYPDGLYAEGWLIAPYKMETPSRGAPFHYPLTAA